MSNHFTIKVPCKTYVKAYLETNCGAPADLQHLPAVLKEFKRALSRKPSHRESAELARYKDLVTIIIPSDIFYRCGWEMNKENILEFNRFIELKVKFNMRQYIALNNCLGQPVANCIREFQEGFGFPDYIWEYDSIKKDFDRNGRITDLKTLRDLKGELNKKLLANLSELGTISKKFKNEYIYG
jgi:hypothetical protein